MGLFINGFFFFKKYCYAHFSDVTEHLLNKIELMIK